ncbi:MAG TPA: NAD(P)/FAD-dependent oxidoreductase [Myxococcota bacterium]|nr:NAD(P)/FAD-dependent oxidoreductase [Myxococcota bacterium]HRY96834.1 NAD(P)/FAD-dependent oxidoreductase [Myxococcota bacterium]HSA21680.1 NAD(P)/FAD-dependent oxidoreductase [Myxococcota bacterium]
MLDLLIVGAGPAGVSCALQASRDGLAALLLGDEPIGGLLGTARRLDNLPGQGGISGPELARRLATELEQRAAPFRRDRVEALELIPGGGFRARLEGGARLDARTICLATGTRPAPLPGWAAEAARLLPGRLVREARALPTDLEGSRVVVAGGGEAALDTALWARDRGAAVEILLRGAAPRAPAALVAEARAAGVRLGPGTEVQRAEPAPDGTGWRLGCSDGRTREAGWLVVCIGREPRLELRPDPLPPGVFLAGDVQSGQARYAALAMADGLRAALAARALLEASR